MRARTRLAIGAVGALAAAGLLTGCGDAGSSGTDAPAPSGASGRGCAPVAGDQLVVLTDDKKLQNTDNVIPAINAKAASPQLIAALDKVSAALDTAEADRAQQGRRRRPQDPAGGGEGVRRRQRPDRGHREGPGRRGHGRRGQLHREPDPRRALQDRADRGRLTRSRCRDRQPRALRAGPGEGRDPGRPGVRGDAWPSSSTPRPTARTPSRSPRRDLDKTVSALKPSGDKAGLTFGTPSAAQDQNAFAVTKAFADKYGVKTLSDLAAKCSGSGTVLAGPPECPQRPKCQAGPGAGLRLQGRLVQLAGRRVARRPRTR